MVDNRSMLLARKMAGGKSDEGRDVFARLLSGTGTGSSGSNGGRGSSGSK